MDAELVHRLVAGQFPQWTDEPVRPVGKPGVDNSTYRLGADKMVRLPRFDRWIGQVHREQKWLPWLAPRLPLPIPTPLAQGEPAEGYPFPWSVYGWLPGERATRAELTDQTQAAKDLAEFFTTLWRLDASGGPAPEWSNGFRGCDLADERDSPVVTHYLEGRIRRVEGLVDTGRVRATWERGLATPVWHQAPVWVHGDPAPGNLLVTGGRLSAVIDFGTLAVGDPAVDLIAAWTLLGPEGRAVFREATGVDEDTWQRGRVWGLSALLPAPDEITEEALADLENVLADR